MIPIPELKLLELMNANRSNPQGLVAPSVSDPNILSQIQGIERSPVQSLDSDMGEAETQLRAMLGQMPQRGNYDQPNIGRRIMAGMVGMGAMRDPRYLDAADQVNNPQYYNDVAEWGMKLKPLKELSDTEQARRTNERLIESSERTAALTEKRLSETERNNRERVRVADARNEIADFKAKNPGYESVVAKDGKLVLWHPVTGDLKETGLDTTKMDEALKLNLQIKGRLDEAAERGRQARMTAAVTGEQARLTGAANEAVRQPNRLEVIDRAADRRVTFEAVRQSHREALLKMQQAGAITLRQTPTGNFMIMAGTGGKGLLPTQEKVDRLNRMQQIISQYPELEEYYEINPDTHDVKIASPDSGFFGLGGDDEAERMRAYNLLFPPKATTPVPATSPQTVKPSATPVSGRRIKVKDKDGNVFTLPAEQLDIAKTKGYTEVP